VTGKRPRTSTDNNPSSYRRRVIAGSVIEVCLIGSYAYVRKSAPMPFEEYLDQLPAEFEQLAVEDSAYLGKRLVV
jgi:hypothetical protein